MESISVIIPTFNSGSVLDKCLQSLRKQNYNQNKIEILIPDGGSTDKTAEIIKKYNAKLIPENTGSPEAAKAIALKQAKGKMILMLASDNILPGKNWLKKMIACLEQESKAVAAYPWRYQYRKKDNPLNRYFALLGANDPIAWFLGKADRQSFLSSNWTLAGKVQDKKNYFLIKFTPQNMPTLGDNGFLIKRDLLIKAKVNEKHFFHIDVNLDLVRKGYDQYVVVKNSIVHASGEKFWPFFKKRKKYIENLYLKNLSRRRYHIYNKSRNQKKIILFSIYALTGIGPMFDAGRGFLRIPDFAWFLHPIVCFLIFWTYFFSVTKNKLLS